MRCNFRLLHVVPLVLLATSSPSFANMAEWTRNSSPDPEPMEVQAEQSPNSQNNNSVSTVVQKPQVNNVQRPNQNIVAPAKPIIPENKYSSKQTNQQAAAAIDFSGIQNGASLTQFMQQSQAITRQANMDAARLRLTPKSLGALNVYTANLMSVGVDVVSGDDPRDSLRNYNQSVGCINGLHDQNLIIVARNALASTIRTLDIRRVISGAIPLGSTTTSNCA